MRRLDGADAIALTIRRRIARLQRDPDDAAAARFDDVAADDGVCGPVGAFDEHIRLQRGDDLVRRVLVEDHHRIDARQRREDFGALRARE